MPNKSKTKSFITAALLLSATTAFAADYAPSSILASGQWVKVHVDSTSVYRIDYPTLQSWGFSEPEKVRVFGYGSVEQAHTLDTAPDDLPAVAVWHSGDALYFYGEGDSRISPSTTSALSAYRNYYSRGSNYFLTATLPGLTITDTLAESPTSPTNTHIAIDCRYPEELNYHSAGVFFFSKDISGRPEGLSYTFSAPDFADNGYLAYRYAYLHSESSAQNINVEFSGAVTPASFSPATHKNNTIDNRLYSLATLKKIPVLSASETPFTVKFTIPADMHFDRLAFSEIYWMYSRRNNFRGPVMTMHFLPSATSSLNVCIGELTDRVEVWDVSSQRSVSRLPHQQSANGESFVTLPSHQTALRQLCLFTPGSDIPQPTFAGSVTCRDLHSLPATDYLIVTTESLLPEAERLAAAHREKQGLDVTVVSQNDIFNEFSSGSSHPNALRKFVRMLYQRPEKPLRYLLLLGAATYDPRHNLSDDGIEYLAGYEVERADQAASSATDYATDLYFGFMTERITDNLSATYTEIPISIGRAPVLTKDEARIFVDKSIAYLNDPSMAGRPDLAVLAACEGDKDAHLKGSEKVRTDILKLRPGTTCARIYNALYPFDKKVEKQPTFSPLASQLARGPFLLNYTGHSGSFEIGSVLSASGIKRLTFSSMPITFFASCETMPINATYRGIGTELFLHPKGPIAVIGSGRDVYLTNNHTLNEEFTRQLLRPNGPERIGDVWRTAINVTGKYGSVQRINNFCYNFIADPALPVRRPDRIAVIDHDSDDPNTAQAAPSLSAIQLKGRITLADGSTDSGFDGSLLLSLYDAPRIARRYVHSAGDSDTIMELDESLLLEVPVEVKGGIWSATVTPPLSSQNGRNRITMHAYSTSGNIAFGMDSTLTVQPPLATLPTDTTAPQIECYLNSPDMPDGAETGPSVTLHANISDDESGLANGTANIGDMPTAVIDSSSRLENFGSALRFGQDGKAEIIYPIENLSDGRHTITVSARDVAGNTARKTLTFTVVSNPFSTTLTADSTIVRESVEFSLAKQPSADLTCRLIVRNLNGSTVFSQENASFPFCFDFRDDKGSPLPDGLYRASVIISDGIRYGYSPETEVTLIRPKY